MILDCVIIDDEPLARKLLEGYVEKTSFLNLKGSYNSAINAIQSITEEPVQLVFLDIQMPDLNGLDFARMLPPSTRVIFTTAYPEHAVEGFRINALDYLMKPIEYTQFLESANKALAWHQQREDEPKSSHNSEKDREEFIYVKSDYKIVKVRFDEILYIEGLKDYLKIHLEDRQRPILTLISMKNMEDRLPSPRFMRVHRSFIVNTDKIDIIERAQIVFNQVHIPISDGYKTEFLAHVNEHSL